MKLLLIVATLGVLLGGLLVLGPVTLCDTRYPIRLSGRVLDARTGRPISGAWVMSFPGRRYATDPEWLDLYRKEIQMYDDAKRQGARPVPATFAPQCGGGETDSAGRFEFDLAVPWGWTRYAFGIRFRSTTQPRRHGVASLRVELRTGQTMIVNVSGGSWAETGASGRTAVEAHWDLGDVEVRSGS